jgi:hypothetical protein
VTGNVHGLVFFDIDGANIQPPSGRARVRHIAWKWT